MPRSDEPVRVVQCPQCGGRVKGAQPGAVVACDYCGATLQMTVGASGNLIARLASIDDSTAFLARTAAVKRVRAQLRELEPHIYSAEFRAGLLPEWQKNLQGAREAVEAAKKAKGEGTLRGFMIVGFFLTALSGGALLGDALGISREPLTTVNLYCAWIMFILGAVGLYIGLSEYLMEMRERRDRVSLWVAKRDKLEGQRDENERVHPRWQRELANLEAEHDRLQRRLDELESGLDELTGRL